MRSSSADVNADTVPQMKMILKRKMFINNIAHIVVRV